MLSALLAQTSPLVLSTDAAFAWPVVLAALGAAIAIGQALYRVAVLDRDLAALKDHVKDIDGRLGATREDLVLVTTTLGEIKAGVTATQATVAEIQRELRSQVR